MFYYSHYSYLFADSATRLLHFGSRQVSQRYVSLSHTIGSVTRCNRDTVHRTRIKCPVSVFLSDILIGLFLSDILLPGIILMGRIKQRSNYLHFGSRQVSDMYHVYHTIGSVTRCNRDTVHRTRIKCPVSVF